MYRLFTSIFGATGGSFLGVFLVALCTSDLNLSDNALQILFPIGASVGAFGMGLAIYDHQKTPLRQ